MIRILAVTLTLSGTILIGLPGFFTRAAPAAAPLPRPVLAASPAVLTDTLDIQIVGGTPATPGEYPWMALVYPGGYLCGGSLIGDVWVLTAAHCVYDDAGNLFSPGDFQVTLGDYDRTVIEGTEQVRAVSQVIPHPTYSPNGDDFDVALLRLSKPVTLIAGQVETITLVTADTLDQAAVGTNATVTGWGTTSYGGSVTNELYEVVVPIVSNQDCSSAYGGGITAGMLCAGYAEGGKDSCQGDSGGPLIVPDGGSGWLQAGVVSWGYECAFPGYYGVYARVSQYADWILTTAGISYDGGGGGPTPTPTLTPTPGPMDKFVYLPVILRSDRCLYEIGDVADDIDQLPRGVVSGQELCGQVSNSDWDDVYRIYAGVGQQLTLKMSGTGTDADLYLFAPGTPSVYGYSSYASSLNSDSSEFIQVTLPQSGYWYIDVYWYINQPAGTTDYQLTVTLN